MKKLNLMLGLLLVAVWAGLGHASSGGTSSAIDEKSAQKLQQQTNSVQEDQHQDNDSR